jgi:sterol desaturase/sphingolipid hydroxylase (fatty acid hydroxylase superfamily)
MEWLGVITDSWLATLAWLAGLTFPFAALAFLMPCNRCVYWWKDLRAAGTDLLYWFLTPLIVRVGRTLLLTAGILLLFGGSAPGFAFIPKWPIWQQCLAVLLLQDVMLYWIHRIFHTRPGWRFHAVHHSPALVDWLSGARSHFVNTLLSFVLVDAVVQLVGFSPVALLLLAPFNIVYSSMVHANLNWTFGPLRYVFASPVFHRWHHSVEKEAIDKNFASTFPFLDLLFGTFYMPAGKLPQRFGNGAIDYPEDFWGQFIQPFRKEKSPPEHPATGGQRMAA